MAALDISLSNDALGYGAAVTGLSQNLIEGLTPGAVVWNNTPVQDKSDYNWTFGGNTNNNTNSMLPFIIVIAIVALLIVFLYKNQTPK